MRTLVALVLTVLAAGTALAADGERYANARFGYAIVLPAGFAPDKRAPDNGDGLTLRNEAGTQRLAVWGGQIVEADFDAHAQVAIGSATQGGWRMSYQAVTPGWASYSGSRNGQVLYGRAIALCDGLSYASFQLEYPERDIARMNAVIDRLVATLRPDPAC